MERLEYDSYGGPELVHLRSFTPPKPQSDEVIIRVVAASINPLDWKIRKGEMKMVTGSKFPRAFGTDFAGIVESVGSQVVRFAAQDAVVGTVPLKGSGAFAPRLITKQNLIVKKPENLSFAQAAALPIACVTAWLALVKNARLMRGQRLFINGAAGAVGQAAIAIARDIGAEVVGRMGPDSILLARSLGLRFALDYTKPLPTALDRTFDVVLDANGSLSLRQGGRLIKRSGKIVDIVPTPLKFLKAVVSRRRKVVFSNMNAKNLQPVIDLATAGKLALPIAQSVTLAQAPGLLAALEHGKRLNGKAIIRFQSTDGSM